MLIRFFKSNQAYHFILIPFIVLVLWLRSYLFPEFYPFFEGENMMPLYKPLYSLLSKSAFVNNLLAMAFVILLSFIILRLNTVYSFIRVRTFFPSNIFVLILSGLLPLHTLHPVYFGALFLLISIDRIFGSYEERSIHSNAFDSGFFIGLGSLFYLPLIFYFPLVWIGFLLIRKTPNWRNFVLPLVGIVVPWLFAYTYYFVTDSSGDIIHVIQQNLFTKNYFLRDNINLQIYVGFLVFITFLGSLFMLGQYDEKKVSARKYFQIFFLIFLVSLALLIFVPSVSLEVLIIMAIPLTFLISNYLIFMRRQFLANLFFAIFLGLIIYLQLV